VGLLGSLAWAQSGGQAPHDAKLTLQQIFAEGGIIGRPPENLQWSPDNGKLSFVQRDDSGEHGSLWYVDAATGEKKELVSETKLTTLAPPLSRLKDDRAKEQYTRYGLSAYFWAPDGRALLFDAQGQLWLYSLDSNVAVQVTSAPDPSQDPKFSPDGTRLAYVRNHNLYVRGLAGDAEKALTNDKDENLLNGEVDWVYEEELSVRSNYFWSPDGKHIAFLQMNETGVPIYPLVDWMPTHPRVSKEHYPKAGDTNPAVRLGVVGSDGGKVRWVQLTEDRDVYIPRFGWVNDGIAWAEVVNRAQNQMDLYFVDAHSGRSRKVLTETAPDAWVNVTDDFRILKSGDRFVWTSWRSGDTHLYLYSFDSRDPLAADAKLEKDLTPADWRVLEVEAVDDAAGMVYFTSDKENPRQRQVYAAKLDGSGVLRVSREDGTHSVMFSKDGKHYSDTFSNRTTAPVFSVCNPGAACHKVWESKSVAEYELLPPKFLEFKAADKTTKLYGELLLPAAGTTGSKIPLVVYIYGGPVTQTAVDVWGEPLDGLFHQRLAQLGYAVFTVDNRGTPGRDRSFATSIRNQYGAIELADQLAALDQLFAEVPQLDRNRVAIWGWSNGGSMTLYSMLHSDAFKTGIAVAPVTDWRNYDSIYTERYYGLPKDNGKAYQDLRLTDVANQLHGALLLVHGTNDDNVHFQNSVQFVESLIQAGKQFRFMIYPGKTHGISGTADQVHLFQMMEDQLNEQLMK
jgi:dipeptidyl-peptidase-4